jgi:hypothetical protein
MDLIHGDDTCTNSTLSLNLDTTTDLLHPWRIHTHILLLVLETSYFRCVWAGLRQEIGFCRFLRSIDELSFVNMAWIAGVVFRMRPAVVNNHRIESHHGRIVSRTKTVGEMDMYDRLYS